MIAVIFWASLAFASRVSASGRPRSANGLPELGVTSGSLLIMIPSPATQSRLLWRRRRQQNCRGLRRLIAPKRGWIVFLGHVAGHRSRLELLEPFFELSRSR